MLTLPKTGTLWRRLPEVSVGGRGGGLIFGFVVMLKESLQTNVYWILKTRRMKSKYKSIYT